MKFKQKEYRLTCSYCGKEFASATYNRTYCTDRRCKEKALAAKRERIRLAMRSLRKWKKRHKTF